MAYIGNPPAERYSSVSYQDLTGGTGTSFTLDYAVGSANEIEVFVNNVRQEPSVAYTVSGTALTMTGSIASTDDFYVVFQGKAQQTVTHPATHALEATDGTFSSAVTANGVHSKYNGTDNITTSPTASGVQIGSFTNGYSAVEIAGTSGGFIDFSSADGTDFDGRILYAHSDDSMNFYAGGSERAAITPNGITFNGDTAAANALDDYEEGTWTPTFIGSTSNPTVTFTEQQGTYIKVGGLIYIEFRLAVGTTSGGSGNLSISGLPYAHKTRSGYVSGALSKAFVYNMATDIDTLFVTQSQSIITMYSSDNTNSQSQVSSLQNGCYVTASGCYEAD